MDNTMDANAADPCLYESVNNADSHLDVELDWHSEPEILYFKSGHYRIYLDMEEIEINDECFCIVNAGVLHKIESLDGKGIEYSLPFRLSALRFSEEDTVQQKLIGPLISGELCFPPFINVSDIGFLSLLRPLNDCIRRFRDFGQKSGSIAASVRYTLTDAADQLLFKADLLHVIGLLESYGMIREPADAEEDRQVKVIKDSIMYIREHYSEKLYIHDLSDLTGLNEQYFIRFFGSAVGASPLEYINRYRVGKAQEMLHESDLHVYEIAESCGFHNIGNFIKIFHSITGVTPHKFRKQLGLKD